MTLASTYRDLGLRTKIAVGATILECFGVVIDTLVPGSSLQVLEHAKRFDPDVAFAWAVMIVDVVALVAMLVWIHGAVRNARALRDNTGFRFTPMTAVGWFFLPLVNVYMPYRAISEAWRASEQSSDWQKAPLPKRVLAWWILLWVSAFVGDDDPTALGFAGIAGAFATTALFIHVAMTLLERQRAMRAVTPASVAPTA